MATAELAITIDQFIRLSPPGKLCELVAGRIVERNPPKPWHGVICSRVSAVLLNFVEENSLGWVVGNDSGVITHRDPDTLRGPDVCYYSHSQIADASELKKYPQVAPELVCEVMSEHDRWIDAVAKAAEYLQAGVKVVCIFDPDSESATLLRGDCEPQVLDFEEHLTIPTYCLGSLCR